MMYRYKSYGIILTVLFSRTILAVLSQGIFSLITNLSNHPLTYLESGRWWTVYGTLIDIGCFVLLIWLLKIEGTNIGNLIGFSRSEIKKDVKLFSLTFVILLPLTIAWGTAIAFIIYGTASAPIIAGPLPRLGDYGTSCI
ncbi:hypothetical protein ACIQXV_11715 [Neobacillus sp. NPDC097160]|uniref:hypothetical protein n=1 Tax=Neobacillus sp. NPDC097160 TaxID=3364298 RepID=UPI00381CC7A7